MVATGKALELGYLGASLWSDGQANFHLGSNVYVASSGSISKFAGTGYAAIYRISAGVHDWLTSSASGTAGNTATMNTLMALSVAGVLTVTNLATGSLTSASGVITSSSDERLKDISGPLEYGLAEVLALRPIRYHWNKASGIPTEPEYGGFGAMQVETQMPLAVSMGKDGYRGLNDRVILGAAVNAIQELCAEFNAYKEAHP